MLYPKADKEARPAAPPVGPHPRADGHDGPRGRQAFFFCLREFGPKTKGLRIPKKNTTILHASVKGSQGKVEGLL